ncbi:BAG family molecular chaperone regulator 4 isoform X1 [Emydura macquarii macquarii]|uniref:BAG family molecular chaperone regulator 4 isoform X1 n=1 Tax=Emydura macquarii macquarii TaxID=1129001 RepID=UPI00352B1F1C
MSALRRRLYGPEAERARPEPEPPPGPSGMEHRACPQHRGAGPGPAWPGGSYCPAGGSGWDRPGRGGGPQEQPSYPGYGSNYWNSAVQPRAPYPSPYPAGPELQSQGMESPYTNGAYGAPYPSAPGAAPHYANLPQSNTYYSSGHAQAAYPSESPSMYRSPSPASHWNYPPPDCPPEGPSLRRQVPGYPPPQTLGMPVPHYPYGGDTNPGIPPQGPPPQPRTQDESWASSGTYAKQPRYAWPAASTPQGSPFVPESSPVWPGNGAPSPHPPAHDTKDAAYDKPDQGANQHNYFPEVNHQPCGTMNDHKRTPFNTKPSPFNPKVQYSAQPQMYDNVPRKPSLNQDAGFKPSDQPSSNSLGMQPGIQRVMQVLEEVEPLEQEVDEFVGKKTDKAYRLLEEMLTKELLELDSIETRGQDNVRQARKEAVHRIQAILEKLERKGF